MPDGHEKIISPLAGPLKNKVIASGDTRNYFERLAVMNTGGNESAPAERPVITSIQEKKNFDSSEAAALAESKLRISRELEKKVSQWFEITSRKLGGEEVVKKEIDDFLTKIEVSAVAIEPSEAPGTPRAPQDYAHYRLYQLLKSLVTGEPSETIEPKAYIKFDLVGSLSMFDFMAKLAERAEAQGKEKGEPAIEKLPSFENKDIFLCPHGRGHAIHKDAVGSRNDCPKHAAVISRKNMGRDENLLGSRRDYFLKKNEDGSFGWVVNPPFAYETDVLTPSGTYRALITPPSLQAPAGK